MGRVSIFLTVIIRSSFSDSSRKCLMPSLNSNWGSGPESSRQLQTASGKNLSKCSAQFPWQGCVHNHSGNLGWPWRLPANFICCWNTGLALTSTQDFAANYSPILSTAASNILLFGQSNIYSCNADFLKSAQLSQGQTAQITVWKIKPKKSNKSIKLVFYCSLPKCCTFYFIAQKEEKLMNNSSTM